ncbi:hypothetical protein CMI37_31815 [Candidatus Pacearchaeota archaeon]|nr:hypothetical protein [Candidatus Pacearchaeota archaeon]|tara:strand:- start:726 stop:1355 length:630 start_codon:yes stop_codon:yes gene_type:complete
MTFNDGSLPLVLVNGERVFTNSIFRGSVTIKTTSGIDYKPGSDTDTDLITIDVTGSPKLLWDESEDAASWSHDWILASGKGLGANITPRSPIDIKQPSGDAFGGVLFKRASNNATFALWQESDQFRITYASNASGADAVGDFVDCVRVNSTGTIIIEGTSGFLEMKEISAPGAGATDKVRIYAVVDGGSLTDLAAVFQDGTVDIFAQEV